MEEIRISPPPNLVEHSIMLEPWDGRAYRRIIQEKEARPQGKF